MWIGNEYRFTPYGHTNKPQPAVPTATPVPPVTPQVFKAFAPSTDAFGQQGSDHFNGPGQGVAGNPNTSGSDDGGGIFGGVDFSSNDALGYAGDALGFAGNLTGSTPLGFAGLGISTAADYGKALGIDPDYSPSLADFFGGIIGNTTVGGLFGARSHVERALDAAAHKDIAKQITENSVRKTLKAAAKRKAKALAHTLDPTAPPGFGPNNPAAKGGGNKGGGSKGGGGNVQGGGGPAGGAPGDRSREGGFR